MRRLSRRRSGSSDSPHHFATLGSRTTALRASRSVSATGRRVTFSPCRVGSSRGATRKVPLWNETRGSGAVRRRCHELFITVVKKSWQAAVGGRGAAVGGRGAVVGG